jgi:hypothetical protein
VSDDPLHHLDEDDDDLDDDVFEDDELDDDDDLIDLASTDELFALVVDRALTHRLTAEEREAGMVAFAPDLLPFKELDEELLVTLADDQPMEHEHLGATTCAWAGPPGWLDAFEAGQMLALTIDEQVVLTVVAVDDDLPTLANIVLSSFDRDDEPGAPVSLENLAVEVLEAETDDPTARAPFGDRVTAAGLEMRAEHVARPGFDWDAWEGRIKLDRLVDAYGLSPSDAAKALGLIELAANPAADAEALTAAAKDLTSPALAELVADDLLGPEGTGDVTGLAERLAEHADTDAARGAARWLRARALEAGGDTLGAEREFSDAVALAPEWPPALESLASYAGDRGDAKRMLDLLLRSGAKSSDPTVIDLRDIIARSSSRAGRNDPCPCGSGKKFKACHWGQQSIPLERRVGWLWNKAAAFAQRSSTAMTLVAIARAYAGPVATNRTVINLAFGDSVVIDIALHEGGGFAEFLAARGLLLPEDERALATQWQVTARKVYFVDAVRRGTGIGLVDVVAGERVELNDRLASQTTAVGQHVVLRLVPDGGGSLQIVGGGVVIQPDGVDDLVADLSAGLDAVDTAHAIGTRAVRSGT